MSIAQKPKHNRGCIGIEAYTDITKFSHKISSLTEINVNCKKQKRYLPTAQLFGRKLVELQLYFFPNINCSW